MLNLSNFGQAALSGGMSGGMPAMPSGWGSIFGNLPHVPPDRRYLPTSYQTAMPEGTPSPWEQEGRQIANPFPFQNPDPYGEQSAWKSLAEAMDAQRNQPRYEPPPPFMLPKIPGWALLALAGLGALDPTKTVVPSAVSGLMQGGQMASQNEAVRRQEAVDGARADADFQVQKAQMEMQRAGGLRKEAAGLAENQYRQERDAQEDARYYEGLDYRRGRDTSEDAYRREKDEADRLTAGAKSSTTQIEAMINDFNQGLQSARGTTANWDGATAATWSQKRKQLKDMGVPGERLDPVPAAGTLTNTQATRKDTQENRDWTRGIQDQYLTIAKNRDARAATTAANKPDPDTKKRQKSFADVDKALSTAKKAVAQHLALGPRKIDDETKQPQAEADWPRQLDKFFAAEMYERNQKRKLNGEAELTTDQFVEEFYPQYAGGIFTKALKGLSSKLSGSKGAISLRPSSPLPATKAPIQRKSNKPKPTGKTNNFRKKYDY